MVTAEPSNPGNPAEAWWSEFTREVNTCRLFGPGTNYSVVAGKKVPVEESRPAHRPSTGRETLNSANVTDKTRAKKAKG